MLKLVIDFMNYFADGDAKLSLWRYTSVIFLDNWIEEGREDAVGFRVGGVHTDTRVQVRYPRL